MLEETRTTGAGRFQRYRHILTALAMLTGTAFGAESSAALNSSPRVLYVAPNGNDAAAGTWKSPWRTLQHAADKARAGETVLVREGVYHELVTLAHSGSREGGFITFAAYPGEHAILDGTTITPPSNTWSAFFLVVDQSYIIIKGFELRNFVASLPGQQPAGVLLDGHGEHIEILDNEIHDIEVVRAAGTSCDPDSCNGHGIAVYGENPTKSLHDILIARNSVYALKTGWSETVTLDGNVQDWHVIDNTIHDNDNIGIDAAGFYGFSPDPTTDYARDGEIRGNLVYAIDTTGNPAYLNPDGTYSQFASGIYIDGGAHVVVQQNDSHGNDIGIQVASENTGHSSEQVIVRNNLVYRSLSIGIAIGGYDPTVGGTRDTQIVNNTLYENDSLHAGYGEFFVQSNVVDCSFENNILYANTQGLFISNYVPFGKDTTPVSVDYNLYFSHAGESRGGWMWNDAYYVGYENYRRATHNDGRSHFADPRFIAPSVPAHGLIPGAHSPAFDEGIDLGVGIVGLQDFSGDVRTEHGQIDIGAYEHSEYGRRHFE